MLSSCVVDPGWDPKLWLALGKIAYYLIIIGNAQNTAGSASLAA